MHNISIGYGRVITRQLWGAGGSTEVELSSIPHESKPPERQQAVEAEGISTNLLDLWTEDIRLGIPVMELYVSFLSSMPACFVQVTYRQLKGFYSREKISQLCIANTASHYSQRPARLM